MKFLLMGDLHEGNTTPRSRLDNFQETKNNKIKEILKIVKDKKVNHILQTGDFYDKPQFDTNFLLKQFFLWCGVEEEKTTLKKENPSLIKAYKKYPSMIGVLGNHEMAGGNFNEEHHKVTPYHLFEKIGIPLMQFVSKENPIILETEDGLKIAITGTKYHLDIDKPGYEDDYIVTEKLGDIHIHIVHGYLTDKYKGKMFHHTLVKDIADKTVADLTLTGHDHIGFDLIEYNGKYFLNPGAILRLSNDKKEMKRTIKVVTCEITKENGLVFETIPLKSAPKSEDILDRKKIEQAKKKKKQLEEFKQKVRASSNNNSLDIFTFLNDFGNSDFPQIVVENAIKRVTEKQLANTILKREVVPYKIVKVIMKNFQSHADTVIELDEHLTILVGESGHGKSSVMRAIEWVVKNNPSGRSMVRIGESKTSVTLVLSNGYEITRYVTKSKNGYLVTDPNGETTEYNTKALSEIQAILGFTQIRIDKDMTLDFNFSNQGQSWFLIGDKYTAPSRSKIIGSLYGTHHADAAVREIKSEIGSNRDKNKVLYDKKDKVEKELTQYEHLTDLENQIKFLETKIAEINKIKDEKEKLLQVLKRYESRKQELKVVEMTLKSLPDISQLKLMLYELKEKSREKEMIENNLEKVKGYINKINNTNIAIAQTENLAQYQNLVNRMKVAEENKLKLNTLIKNHHEKTVQLKNQLIVIDKTKNIDSLKNSLQTLKEQIVVKMELEKQIPLYNKSVKALKNIDLSIKSTSHLPKAQEQLKLLKQMVEQKQSVEKLKTDFDKVIVLKKKEEKVIEENSLIIEDSIVKYNNELVESKACPTCFAPITEETTQRILTKFKGGIK